MLATIGVCIALYFIGRWLLRGAAETVKDTSEEGKLWWFGVMALITLISIASDYGLLFGLSVSAVAIIALELFNMRCLLAPISMIVSFHSFYFSFDMPSICAAIFSIIIGFIFFFADGVIEEKIDKRKSESPAVSSNKVE